MWRTKRHIPDGELLLLDEDGALSARRRSAVSRHVAACRRCARRRAELAATLAEAAAACRATPAGASPPHAARARLRAEMETGLPHRWSGDWASPSPRRWPEGWRLPAVAAAAILVVVALGPLADRRDAPADRRDAPADRRDAPADGQNALADRDAPADRRDAPADGQNALADRDAPADRWDAPADRRDAPADGQNALADRDAPADRHGAPADPQAALADRQADAAPPDAAIPAPPRGGRRASPGLERPRHDLTPGRVLPVGVDEVCGAGITGLPPVAAQVPRQVFEAYGVDYRRAADYELDFLITPELGGAPDPRNLWPQPYRAGVWNAYVKDELERELRALVCRGALDLATAQQELADDWIAAYKRRFNTDRPLRDYGRFPLGPGDVEAVRSEFAERRLLPAGGPLASARTGAAPPVYATAAGRRFAAAGG